MLLFGYTSLVFCDFAARREDVEFVRVNILPIILKWSTVSPFVHVDIVLFEFVLPIIGKWASVFDALDIASAVPL